MVKEAKIQAVKEIKDSFAAAELVIFTQFKGLTVSADRQLRVDLHKNNSTYKVYKNNLAVKALSDSKIDGLDLVKFFVGTTSFIFGQDPVAPAKVVAKFSKDNPAITIKGGIYQNKFISAEQVKELAKLPSRQELLAKVVYLLNSPIVGLVNVVQGPIRKLAYALQAIKDKKGN